MTVIMPALQAGSRSGFGRSVVQEQAEPDSISRLAARSGLASFVKLKGIDMAHRSLARYGAVAQVFHWLTAIVVLVAFIFGPGGSEQRVYSHARDFDRQLHETLGLCVLTLVVLRVLWRMMDKRPDPPDVARWMDVSAKAVQGVLYLLLFALPLTAITGAWLEGHPLTLLAGIEIAPPIGTAHAAGETIAEIHTWLGDAIMWVAGLHALAALFHHFFLRDGVLVSMLPRWIPLRHPDE
jgi:cytochrome b561